MALQNHKLETDLNAFCAQKSLPEDVLSSAYAHVPAPYRVTLKAGIALAHLRFGSQALEQTRMQKSLHAGFALSSQECPLNWVLLLCTGSYGACARLCHASLLPRLAGVEAVYVAFLEEQPKYGALLALELSSCNEILQLTYREVPELLALLQGHGGILCLGAPYPKDLPRNLLLYEETEAPILGVDETLFERELIHFLHDTSPIVNIEDPKACAIFCDTQKALCLQKQQAFAGKLVLTEGCAGFWRFPSLSLHTFQLRCDVVLRLAPPSETL